MADRLTVLHLAPHPDDEVLGAGGTLLRLRDAGHTVVNLACSLGRPGQHDRRRLEVEEACRRAGFELQILEPPLRIARDDDLDLAQRALADEIRRLTRTLGIDLVVAPSPHDGHYGHEVVGRAARDALETEDAPPLWMWAIWADLPLPTLFASLSDEVLSRAAHALHAHVGELARNDYADLLRCRAITARVLGSERVFGFGQRRRNALYAELLTEATFTASSWQAGEPRELDPADPVPPVVAQGRPLGWWMAARSFNDRLRAEIRASPDEAQRGSS